MLTRRFFDHISPTLIEEEQLWRVVPMTPTLLPTKVSAILPILSIMLANKVCKLATTRHIELKY